MNCVSFLDELDDKIKLFIAAKDWFGFFVNWTGQMLRLWYAFGLVKWCLAADYDFLVNWVDIESVWEIGGWCEKNLNFAQNLTFIFIVECGEYEHLTFILIIIIRIKNHIEQLIS